MKEVLLTSSVLIAVLLILRRLFRNFISRRVQYALWGLVLLRLLVPVSLLPSAVSVMNAVERVEENRTVHVIQDIGRINIPTQSFQSAYDQVVQEYEERGVDVDTLEGSALEALDYEAYTKMEGPTVAEVVRAVWRAVWLTGIAGMACWLALSNLRFWLKLRKGRAPCAVEGCQRKVWLVEEGLSTPCLFGLFRPAIYLTPAAVAGETGLRHVLAHEETHARHLDPLWSLLRGVCLAIYWFDPLVWWAAFASRADCELACDEGALRRLGEEERLAYGRTLLSLVPVRKTPANPLLSATTMTAGKRQLKDRITRIAEHRRTVTVALLAVVVVAALVCAATFTGADTKAETSDDEVQTSPIRAEVAIPTDDEVQTSPIRAETAIPTVYPERGLCLAIHLTGLEPYNAPTVTVKYHENDVARQMESVSLDGITSVEFYCSTDGKYYAGIRSMPVSQGDQFKCFLTLPDENFQWEIFYDLFGYSGLMISYADSRSGGTFYDYYSFDGDPPVLLARVHANEKPQVIDLDGDGVNELVGADDYMSSPAAIIFQRDGQTYEVDAAALPQAAWPEMTYWDYSAWDADSRCLYVRGYRKTNWFNCPESMFWRCLYFDGENLLVYKDSRETEDHVMDGVNVPEDVLNAAKSVVREKYEAELMADGPGFDDWRIERMSGPWYYQEGDFNIEVWRMNYEMHTTTPELVGMAGGRYITEDAWVSPGYPDCDYLFFQVDEDGNRTYLYTAMENDCSPGTELFRSDMIARLEELGLLPADSRSYYLLP